MTQQSWNTNLYQDKHAFVWQYGESLLELLAAKPEERILDLGCGTGQLTDKIAQTGANVQGIDASAAMIATAKQNYPHLDFTVADARNFQLEQPVDAVFSNAVLHWIKEADDAIACIKSALKPSGRFVAEFGGKGNIQAITQALCTALEEIGLVSPETLSPWYFPSIGDYASRLEQQGFDVTYAALFDRTIELEGGDTGMRNWIEMFANGFLSGLLEPQKMQVLQSMEENLQPILYKNGTWLADYRRIRIVAIKL
jgi:trans-aconitate methyltransferase